MSICVCVCIYCYFTMNNDKCTIRIPLSRHAADKVIIDVEVEAVKVEVSK